MIVTQLLTYALATAASVQQYRPFMFDSPTFFIDDGISFFRSIRCTFSFEFGHLIVMDYNCGQEHIKCKPYCADQKFHDLYCDYRCETITRQMSSAFCNRNSKTFRYNGTLSRKSKQLGGWKWQTAGLRKMYGQLWSDRIRIFASPVSHAEITQLNIVSATYFDARALGKLDGIAGLAPDPNNPLYQMAKIRALHPIVTISHNFWAFRNQQKRRPFTVGSVDKARCAEWEFVDSMSPHRWVFEITEVDFMGVKTGRSMGTFSYSQYSLAVIGTPIAQKLTSNGVAKLLGINYWKQEYFAATVPCDYEKKRLPPIVITIGNIKLFLNESASLGGIKYEKKKPVGCFLNINVDHKSPYQTDNAWIFGYGLFREYCVAFDYEKLRIGFARLRKKRFPYLQQGYPLF